MPRARIFQASWTQVVAFLASPARTAFACGTIRAFSMSIAGIRCPTLKLHPTFLSQSNARGIENKRPSQTYRAFRHAILAAESIVALAFAIAVAHTPPPTRDAQYIWASEFACFTPIQGVALAGGEKRAVVWVLLHLPHAFAVHVAREDIAPRALYRAVLTTPSAKTCARTIFLANAAFRARSGSSTDALDCAVASAETREALALCGVEAFLDTGPFACTH